MKNIKVQDIQNITVHIICHSHDDIGWLKTVDEYYYGDKYGIQPVGVQYILDSVVKYLALDKTKKFIEVEIGFFWRWWKQQNSETQKLVRQLITDKQLQFVNAGWCMNDEAATYYEDIIDQMTLGHQFILDTFNYVPNIGWHIDPFGHSNQQASIFSQMGFDAFFIGRIDYQDNENRQKQQSLEFIWKAPQSSKIQNDIFGFVIFDVYGAPDGFCYDQTCQDDPIMDDPRLEGYNLDKKGEELYQYFQKMATFFKHPIIAQDFGDDFNFQNAKMYFKNTDKLFNYINSNPDKFKGMNIIYSSPNEYIQAINKYNISYPVNEYDFMPYANAPNQFWSGYFTSRIADKGQVRYSGRWAQSIKNYLALLKISNSSNIINQNKNQIDSSVFVLEQALAVLQHHDAITGTAKQKVQDNYYFIISNATDTVEKTLNPILQEQTEQIIKEKIENFNSCLWNLTSSNCQSVYDTLSSYKSVLVTVFNPSMINNLTTLRIKVPSLIIDVFDSSNNKIKADLFCLNQTDQNDCDIYFQANLTGFQLNYFKLLPLKKASPTSLTMKVEPTQHSLQKESETLSINEILFLKIKKIKNQNKSYVYQFVKCEQQVCVDQEEFTFQLNYYRSYQDEGGPHSGAYLFRPEAGQNESIPYSIIEKQQVFQGQILTIVNVIGDKFQTQMKFYKQYQEKSDFVELETFIDSISIDDGKGKEVVLLVQTNVFQSEKNSFYTDSNGLETQKRILNVRPTWNLTVLEPVSGNYYPINSYIYIENNENKRRAVLLNDRAQGGTSLKPGQLELMISRRCLKDDNKGVREALNETNPWNSSQGLQQKMKHYIFFEDNSDYKYREIQQKIDQSPILFFSSTALNKFQSINQKKPLVDQNIPQSLKIYLRYYKDKDQYIVRLQNMDEKQQISASLSQIGFGNEEITETTLTANQKLSDWEKNKLKWQTEQSKNQEFQQKYHQKNEADFNISTLDDSILLLPLQIRTFIVKSQQAQQILMNGQELNN